MSVIRFLFVFSAVASNVHYAPTSSGPLSPMAMAMGSADLCTGAHPMIKTSYNFAAAGSYHCVFIPEIDGNVSNVNFSLKNTRSLCSKFKAGLLQLRDPGIQANLVDMAKKYPASGAKKWYHPLGIDQQERHYPGNESKYIPDISDQMVNVTWDSGQTTLIDTEAIYGKLLAAWSKADREGVTYMSRLWGTFMTEEPGRTQEFVRILCHQWEGEFHPKFNVCSGMVPEIKAMAKFFISGKAHCVFHPPDEKEALNEKSRDLGYWFELDDLRKSCRNYYGKLLQFPNAEIYHAIINVTQQMDSPIGTVYPLGIKSKYIVVGQKDPQPAGMNITITWDDGQETVVVDKLAFGTTPWHNLRGSLSFLELPSGDVYTQEPSALKGPVIPLCHKEEPIAKPVVPPDPPPMSIYVTTTSGSNIAKIDAKNFLVLVILVLATPGFT